MPVKKREKKKEINEINEINNINEEEIELRLILCKNIQSNINNLSQNELYEIFKILYKNNSTYTKNNNGVFVNLNWLDYNILKQIYDYINFCIKSHKEINKYEILKNMYNENLNKNKKIDADYTYDNNILKTEESEIINKLTKISSSMKFYLFKKKFLKKYNIINNNCNLLSHEDFLLKNDL
tara:strand:- start:386 stop:931 length:546 start_codon:yes stop_codon:yes gene_type:complete